MKIQDIISTLKLCYHRYGISPNSDTTPSTVKQWGLANKPVEELKAIGLDEKDYIMETLPSNVEYEVPTIGFIAHFDTTPDFTGANVKPQVIENYDGKDIILNKEQNIILSPGYFKDLLQYKGQTLITTDIKASILCFSYSKESPGILL